MHLKEMLYETPRAVAVSHQQTINNEGRDDDPEQLAEAVDQEVVHSHVPALGSPVLKDLAGSHAWRWS